MREFVCGKLLGNQARRLASPALHAQDCTGGAAHAHSADGMPLLFLLQAASRCGRPARRR